MTIEVWTAARYTTLFAGSDPLDRHHAVTLPPQTKLAIDPPAMPDQALVKARVVECRVETLVGTEGYVGRDSIHRAYVRRLDIGATGVKYGAAYKTGERSEEAGHRHIASATIKKPKFIKLKGAPVDEPEKSTLVNNHGFTRAHECGCGQSWPDHKILETRRVKEMAVAIGKRLRQNSVEAQMIGVLECKTAEGSTFHFAASGFSLEATNASAHHARALYDQIIVPDSAPDVFLDCNGASVDGLDQDSFATRTGKQLGDLKCAAPRLMQSALHKIYDGVAQENRAALQFELFMSEIWVGSETDKHYAVEETADSCNLCRSTMWRFLCGYTNNYKKASIGRDQDWTELQVPLHQARGLTQKHPNDPR